MCATSIHVAAGLVQSHDAAAGAQSPAPRIPPAAASEGVAVGRVSSRFRGLCHDKKHDTWRVRIFYLGKQRHIGRFKDEVDAARAYDKAAHFLYGPRAVLNFSLKEAAEDTSKVPESIRLAKAEGAGPGRRQTACVPRFSFGTASNSSSSSSDGGGSSSAQSTTPAAIAARASAPGCLPAAAAAMALSGGGGGASAMTALLLQAAGSTPGPVVLPASAPYAASQGAFAAPLLLPPTPSSNASTLACAPAAVSDWQLQQQLLQQQLAQLQLQQQARQQHQQLLRHGGVTSAAMPGPGCRVTGPAGGQLVVAPAATHAVFAPPFDGGSASGMAAGLSGLAMCGSSAGMAIASSSISTCNLGIDSASSQLAHMLAAGMAQRQDTQDQQQRLLALQLQQQQLLQQLVHMPAARAAAAAMAAPNPAGAAGDLLALALSATPWC